jgi:hypothetical protein
VRHRGAAATIALVPEYSYVEVKQVLGRLTTPEQRSVAVALAELALPFAELTPEGQPVRGISAVTEEIKTAATIRAADLARHELFQIPHFVTEAEPEGLAWYSFRATSAWIYAADALTTSPNDGVANVFLCLDDLLDAADDKLGDTSLAMDLRELLVDQDPKTIASSGMSGKVAEAAARIAEAAAR